MIKKAVADGGFLNVRKVRGSARVAAEPNRILLNHVAQKLVMPISEQYKMAVDGVGYKRKIYFIPSETYLKGDPRFHCMDGLPKTMYVGRALYDIKGFNLGETSEFFVEVKSMNCGDDTAPDWKDVIVMSEKIYQES